MKFEETDRWRDHICRKWGLFKYSDPLAQMVKLKEEEKELKQAILDDDHHEVKDAIGDSMVVLANVAEFYGLTLEECYQMAVETISKRKGHIDPHTRIFIKDEP